MLERLLLCSQSQAQMKTGPISFPITNSILIIIWPPPIKSVTSTLFCLFYILLHLKEYQLTSHGLFQARISDFKLNYFFLLLKGEKK